MILFIVLYVKVKLSYYWKQQYIKQGFEKIWKTI